MSSTPSDKKRQDLERRLTIGYHLPSLSFITLLAGAISAAAFVVWPVASPAHRNSLAAEQVSNHHRMIASACERCHDTPFTGASDSRCLSCHAVTSHAAAFTAKKVQSVDRCASCHKEHHGQRSLVPADSPLCTRCHTEITKVLPETKQPSVNDFAHHPEFTVWAIEGDRKSEKIRVDTEGARVESGLKFSHAEHLGVMQREGSAPETMTCATCHVRSADGKSFVPIAFVRNCQRCHKLEVDPRLKGTPVPHGNVAHAIEVIRAGMAQFHLNEGKGESAAKLRDRVASETREIIDAVFTESDGCKRCHEVAISETAGSPEAKQYKVDPPRLRTRWLSAALFDHGVHRQTACEQCHTRTRASKSGAELLLPGIKVCRDCHADPGTPDKLESPCVECHVYHAK
jgi:hypothetical protein